jgi:ABC-type lipoprotein release transport system permease subunit
VLVAWVTGMMKRGLPSAGQVTMLGAYSAAMTAVCMIACVVPTRRALAVEPTEALRDY